MGDARPSPCALPARAGRRLHALGRGGIALSGPAGAVAGGPLLALDTAPAQRPAATFPDGSLTYGELRIAAQRRASQLAGLERVAVWATPRRDTCISVCAALLAGVSLVPLNPSAGDAELEHVLRDSDPDAVLAAGDESLPDLVAARVRPMPAARDDVAPRPPQDAVLILYTSGTTGSPKGVLMPRRALASNLDALAEAWGWTADDVAVQALPLFHGSGLLVGLIGPLRLGGTLVHVGRFTPETLAQGLADGGTVLVGVPTMYHRLADAAESSPWIADALAGARLLTCGAAGLPQSEHERILRLTGQRVVERYGMTETLVSTAVRHDAVHRPGFVGPPLPGVDLRLVDDAGAAIDASDGETIGEIEVRGDNLFLGYLGDEAVTRAAFRNGWFRTGDLAVRAEDGAIRIMGRRGSDLINSGGYRIGAGEVESALLSHPAIAEAAVTPEADPDLGQRVVAWVVLHEGASAGEQQLIDHVVGIIARHKRPRRIVFLDALPRTPTGKVRKNALGA